MRIDIIRIASFVLPRHPAYVACDLSQVSAVCKLLSTTDTVWSRDDIETLGNMADKGMFDMHDTGDRVSITMKDVVDENYPYRCDNCDEIFPRKKLSFARHISQRLTPGSPYSDVECPNCNALCYPVEVGS